MTTTTIDHLAEQTPATRNRAIDAYRAGAMIAVCIGHWLAAAVVRDGDSIKGGNLLEYNRWTHWLTLGFQVMPLFFCIGGFSSAASIDAHHRSSGTDSAWVIGRMRRLTTPASLLAVTWLGALVLATATGLGAPISAGAAAAAAIPLWFLANYVADTALAPSMLRWHRKDPARAALIVLGAFTLIDLANINGAPVLPKLNIVVGWLAFQLLGYWWRDGLLPSGRTLVKLGAASGAVCAALVGFGPWPLSMVRVPGDPISNTWPPTIALLFFGFAYCAFAIAIAPQVSRLLERSAFAWKLVVAGNGIAMTVYLWHFTAITIVGGTFWALGLLGDAPIGSGQWWLYKLPMLAASVVVLAGIVAFASRKEREGLLNASKKVYATPRRATAIAVSAGAGFELWTLGAGNIPVMVAGMVLLLAASRAARRERSGRVGSRYTAIWTSQNGGRGR